MEKDIEKYVKTIDILRKECKQKDREIHQAATFGQQLLNEKIEMRNELQTIQTQLEGLKQENYSLQLKLESQKQTLVTQTAELETQTKTVDDLKRNENNLENLITQKKQRFVNLEKEKRDLEISLGDLQKENISLKNYVKLLENQVESLKEGSNSFSLNETGIVEDTHNLSMHIAKISELEDALAEIQQELKTTKLNENRLTSLVKALEEAVSERDQELSSYSVEIQREKDYAAELQCEIEVLKLDQLDPKRRGNSMFEELDDRRKLVEKEYKILSKKYESVLKNYEKVKEELNSCKGHLIILQSENSKQCHTDAYIKKLEDSLYSARREVKNLTFKLDKTVKAHAQQNPIQTPPSGDKYDYLRVMNQQAEEKARDAENELILALMRVKDLNERLSESHRDVYRVQKDLSDLKTENLKLSQEIKELKPDTEPPAKPKPRIEIRPGFESNPKTLKIVEMALNENKQRPNEDIIPGELLLTENGYVEIKAPRLSNRAMLRNNLHKINAKKSATQEKETLNKIQEDTENVESVIKDEPSTSQVKPNQCAQQ